MRTQKTCASSDQNSHELTFLGTEYDAFPDIQIDWDYATKKSQPEDFIIRASSGFATLSTIFDFMAS